MYTIEEVLDFVEEEDVKFIRLAFFDLAGVQKNISIMAGELRRAFEIGISIDGSSIMGFQDANRSDLFLHPDPSTLTILPWRPSSGKVVRMFCDIRYSDGTPYEKDSRFILQKAVKAAKDQLNIQMNFGTEVEFYLFKLDEKGEPTKEPFDHAGYMDIAPEDKGENIRRDICFTLEQMGITPEASHHEGGPGQNEIDFLYGPALTAADNCSTFKWIVRTKAAASGLFADFSPKPLLNEAGSGMHINISCRSLDKDNKTNYIPQVVAGILSHIEEITYFLNPAEDSYKRLGECKAPKFICWGNENRSSCIRIPAWKLIQRLEVRSADPLANPYIAFALLIYAAIDGIKNKMEPPLAVEENLFNADESVTSKFKSLPENLAQAYTNAMNSSWVRDVLGEEIMMAFAK